MSSNAKGFTLIETLVSLVVFLLIAIGVTIGLERAVDGNVFDSQRQDVINSTLAFLHSSRPPTQYCPPSGSTKTIPLTTNAGLAFTLAISCTVVPVNMPAGSKTTVPLTEIVANASWSTFGMTRHVTLYE